MTRDEIIAEAARRLGDQSTAFLAEVSAAFDFVLQDLAAQECISALRRVSTADVTGLDQRNYPTRDLTGLTTPDYPVRIFSLTVWGWGIASQLELVNDGLYEMQRQLDGETRRGRPRIWRVYPNESNVQVHPPADADNSGETIECLYLAPPTVITGGTQIDEVRREHLETVVHGLRARLAEVLEETAADAATYWQLYVAGRDRMWGARFNAGVGQINPADQ